MNILLILIMIVAYLATSFLLLKNHAHWQNALGHVVGIGMLLIPDHVIMSLSRSIFVEFSPFLNMELGKFLSVAMGVWLTLAILIIGFSELFAYRERLIRK